MALGSSDANRSGSSRPPGITEFTLGALESQNVDVHEHVARVRGRVRGDHQLPMTRTRAFRSRARAPGRRKLRYMSCIWLGSSSHHRSREEGELLQLVVVLDGLPRAQEHGLVDLIITGKCVVEIEDQ